MTSQNHVEENESEKLLKKALKCRGKEFKELLKQIEAAIEKSEKKDENLLRAKKAITARMTSRRN